MKKINFILSVSLLLSLFLILFTGCPEPEPRPGGNMIINGDFSHGLDHWSYWVNTDDGVDAVISVVDGVFHADYDAGLAFFCGDSTADDIYIDNVSVVEVP
jgi:hypothetical protein